MIRIAVIVGLALTAGAAAAQDAAPANGPSDGPSQSRAYLAKLIDALRSDDSFKVRLQAAVLLGRSGSTSAVEPLIEALNTDEHYTVRAAAATGLANLQEPRAISHIIKRAAMDADEFVRVEAAQALDKYDRERALPYVMATYDGFETPESAKVRQAAIDYLLNAEVGPEVDTVIKRALGDTPEISAAASDYLVALEDKNRTIAILNDAVRSREPTVRTGAVRVLQKLNTKQATLLILEVYERDIEVEEVKNATRMALRERREFLDLDSIVRDTASGGEKHARGRALKLLGVVGGTEAEKVLVAALGDPDIYVRGNAVLAMQWLGSAAVVPSLEKLATDPGNQRIMHLVKSTLKKLRQSIEAN